jgi:hypothetical protein
LLEVPQREGPVGEALGGAGPPAPPPPPSRATEIAWRERFSGRPAPEHPGGIPNLPDWITREAYSHEVSSCGFWAGSGPIPYPAFYAYAYPEPEGFAEARVEPRQAFYSPDLREFVLPYDAVRTSGSPDDTLLAFLQSTYEAAADLARWDRAALERSGEPGPPETTG